MGAVGCVLSGPLIRVAIGQLRAPWKGGMLMEEKLAAVRTWVHKFGDVAAIERNLQGIALSPKRFRAGSNGKSMVQGGTRGAEIPV
jgi:hypothetical protein